MADSQIYSGVDLPDFTLEEVPVIKIKNLRIKNLKAFEDYTFDFTDNHIPKNFICFMGPNGAGKSTALNCIQTIFTRFEGYDAERLKTMLGKAVRHTGKTLSGVYGEDDFLIEADIHSSIGDYSIQINKNGFVKDHPEKIKLIVYRLCYLTRFDQELNQFQLIREKWPIFKDLFGAVTGYEVEEITDIFQASEDPAQAKMMEKYVLGFWVHKPREIIHHKECSDGEKKIIKSFSTLLNIEFEPQVIAVDNIEMHVELKRHISLIESMRKCFPNSQIFSTTHSYRMLKDFGKRSSIYDLRKMKTDPMMTREPWRFYAIDEVEDAILKIDREEKDHLSDDLVIEGKKIIDLCYADINDLAQFKMRLKKFLKDVADKFVIDIMVEKHNS